MSYRAPRPAKRYLGVVATRDIECYNNEKELEQSYHTHWQKRCVLVTRGQEKPLNISAAGDSAAAISPRVMYGPNHARA